MPNVAYHADIAAMAGKQADQVYTRARSGPTRRSRTAVTNPRTPAQSSARANLAHAATAYRGLTPAQVSAWRAYANTQRAYNALTLTPYVPTPNTVFCGLTCKFLQITPAGTIPLTPPASSFAGDRITFTVAVAVPGLAVTASAANATGVETEFLVQHLASANRTPSDKAYRSKGFSAFVAGNLTHPLPLASGNYAVAYRFVSPTTGQDSPLIPLGIWTV